MPRTTSSPVPTAPSVVLYDGHCAFCTDQAKKLHRFANERFLLRSFQDEGVLDDYPGLTLQDCMKEIKLVSGDGRILGGAEAIVRAVEAGHAVLGKLLFFYYVPGVRQLADRLYEATAARRYSIGGRSAKHCDSGSCGRHGID